LKAPRRTVGIYIGPNGGPTSPNGPAQRLPYSVVKLEEHFFPQGIRQSPWMDPSPEKSFIGIDVPYTGQKVLVEQEGLDGPVL